MHKNIKKWVKPWISIKIKKKREKQQKTAENEVFKTISWAIIANNSSKCINLQQNTRKLANSRIYTKSTKWDILGGMQAHDLKTEHTSWPQWVAKTKSRLVQFLNSVKPGTFLCQKRDFGKRQILYTNKGGGGYPPWGACQIFYGWEIFRLFLLWNWVILAHFPDGFPKYFQTTFARIWVVS